MLLQGSKLNVGPKGGKLLVRDEDKRIVHQFELPFGILDAAPYLDLVPDAFAWELIGGSHIPPRGGYGVHVAHGRYLTAANPSFVPSVADRHQREMETLLARMKQQAAVIEKQARSAQEALSLVERIPDGPGAAEKPQSEPVKGDGKKGADETRDL